MDVSSFLKKLRKQQSLSTETAESAQSIVPTSADGDTAHDSKLEMSLTASDDDDLDSEGDVTDEELVARGGGERLGRKQSLRYNRKEHIRGPANLEQPALKLLATNAGGVGATGSSSRRDASRQMAAMRRRLQAQARMKRPRSDTIDAIRKQLLQDRKKLERGHDNDHAESSFPDHLPAPGDHAEAAEASVGKLDMVDIAHLLDDSPRPTAITLPNERANTPNTIATDVAFATQRDVTTVAPHTSSPQVPTRPPPLSTASTAMTIPDSAPADSTSVTIEGTTRPKKISRFALAKQLAEQAAGQTVQEREVLHYERF